MKAAVQSVDPYRGFRVIDRSSVPARELVPNLDCSLVNAKYIQVGLRRRQNVYLNGNVKPKDISVLPVVEPACHSLDGAFDYVRAKRDAVSNVDWESSCPRLKNRLYLRNKIDELRALIAKTCASGGPKPVGILGFIGQPNSNRGPKILVKMLRVLTVALFAGSDFQPFRIRFHQNGGRRNMVIR